jgi:hypothetical protein
MKKIFYLLLLSFFVFSCNDDCTIEEKEVSSGNPAVWDRNPNSPFFNETIFSVRVYREARVESGKTCKGSTCLRTTSMIVTNLCPKDIEITLALVGKGDFTYSIKKGAEMSISPLPDYCLKNDWGDVKEIKYK